MTEENIALFGPNHDMSVDGAAYEAIRVVNVRVRETRDAADADDPHEMKDFILECIHEAAVRGYEPPDLAERLRRQIQAARLLAQSKKPELARYAKEWAECQKTAKTKTHTTRS